MSIGNSVITGVLSSFIVTSSFADNERHIRIDNFFHIGGGGVSIGNNCVVRAGSIVAKSFPDNSIIVGVPKKNKTKSV